MNTKFLTKLLSVNEIFENNFFEIPDYQRGYSWEEKQIQDFMNDVENLFANSHMHFTGTIVAVPKKGNDSTFEIVDGQQRLTTICILMHRIVNAFPDEFRYLTERFLFRGEVGEQKTVLRTNAETWNFFSKIILENKFDQPKITSQKRILKAVKMLDKWIEDQLKTRRIVEVVTSKLGFIVFTPENTSEIGIMFEVINNRGKRLSELEKIKNYFIYYASIYSKPTLREKVNQSWGKIHINLSRSNIISNDDENSFLRNCYLVFFDPSKSNSWRVYDGLKEKFSPHLTDKKEINENTQQIIDFISFIEEAALHYAYLFNQFAFNEEYLGENKTHLSKILTRIRCQNTHASILPFYLAIMSYLHQKPQKCSELLDILERLNFRVYILPKVTSRADSKQAELFSSANILYWKRNWNSENEENVEMKITPYGRYSISGDIMNWANAILIDFCQHYCPEKKFIQSLTIDEGESENYYHWQGIRFFLASYEEFLQEQMKTTFDIQQILYSRKNKDLKGNDFLSLEHIWASANKKDHFGEHHKEKRRLGNFVLIGLSKNIQLNNQDINDKIEELQKYDSIKGYQHMALKQVTDLKLILKIGIEKVEKGLGRSRKTVNYFKELSTAINDERETAMIKFALNRWKLPDEKLTKFDKVDSFEIKADAKHENFHFNTEQE